MSAFAHSHTKLNMTIGKANKVGKAATSTRVSSKLAILKEQDLRKFLLVKGVEKKLHTVKELVVQEAMLRLKQQQATAAAQVKFAMGPVAPAGKLVVSDVVAVEVHVAANNVSAAPKVIHNKHSACNANGLPPLPPSANVAAPLVFTTNEEPQSFSFDPSSATDGSSRSGGLRRDRRRPSDDDSSERIIIADSFGTTSIPTPLASLNLGNGGNDGTGNNGPSSSSSYATVVNVGPQYFVGAFGEEMNEMRSMPEMSEWFTGTITTTETTTTTTTAAKEGTQRFAAGSAAMAAAAASSAAPPARAGSAADEAATTSTAFDGLLGQRLLRGFGGLDLLLAADATSSSSSSSLVSQEQQQQQTAATTESWHHWQASTVDVTEEHCEKPDSKDKKEKKKDDGLKSKDVLQFGLLVADALCNVLAASQALAGLVLLAGAQLQQQQQQEALSARCAPRREEEEEVAPRQSALLVC